MSKRILFLAFFSCILCHLNTAFAQVPTWTIDLLDTTKKPQKFENRKLGSERMADKKFTFIRHFFQNNYTHYNYYYNAKNKINAVIERAKEAQQDDYSKLISYYPFTLENTASQRSELDSVIFKATAGILLHDLRNDWVDNMYLLMGQAFFLRKDFDSAAATFQFINYNLFPRKKHEEDNRIVGTSDASENNSLSIANKEKQNILQKIASQPPSRNDALIWMARTLIEQNEIGESAGLINTLQHDANLPERLHNDLDDVNAYWFYKQNIYDSAAAYLEKALSNADTKQDRSRSEFLLAQLYEITNQYDKATEYYAKASLHTVNPLMDIYARLNDAKMMKSSNPEALTTSINTLLGMAKKDKFESYRDIIFYSAGELAMQKPDTNAAMTYFARAVQFSESNIIYKNKAFLELANIAYNRKQYRSAYAFYDSLQSGDTTIKADLLATIQSRRNSLSKIVERLVVIEKQDSLQAVAAMPAADRETFIKKMVKRLRKEKGLKEDDNSSGGTAIVFNNSFDKSGEPLDLFAPAKGEWYFYNSSMKSNGLGDFKRKWGTRRNNDNWFRKNAVDNAAGNLASPGNSLSAGPDDIDKPADANRANAAAGMDPSNSGAGANGNDIVQNEDLSYEGLMGNLPLTPEALASSNTLIAVNLFQLAKLFQEELEDYGQAIVTYDESLSRFPDSLYNGELYLGLYFCYTKLGMQDKAAFYKNLLNKEFAGTQSALLSNNAAAARPDAQNAEGTKRYESIYNLFIEGNFEQAFTEKQKADSLYGTSYWTPQLLYIEAVYHVKQRADSTAIGVLQNIVTLYPNAKLAPKAERMIDVLKRRKEIEEYLTKLEITRAKDDEIVKLDEREKIKRNDLNLIKSPEHIVDTSRSQIKAANLTVKDSLGSIAPVIRDSIQTSPAPPPVEKPVVVDSVKKAPTIFTNGPFSLNTDLPHNVIMVLDKVDGTYVNESKNAFTRYLGESFRGEPITIIRDAIDKDKALLVFAPFADANAAYQFLLKIRKAAPEEISWLPANKYSFLLANDENLQLLKENKDIPAYMALLKKAFPAGF